MWISTINKDQTDQHQLMSIVPELADLDDGSPITFFNHCEIPQILLDNYEDMSPEAEAECERKTGYRFIQEFTLAEWGTVLDAKDAELSYQDDGMVLYTFRTCGNPPMGWVQKLSEYYPNLLFEIEATNEFDLFEAFVATYLDGHQIDFDTHKKQRNNK